MTRNRLLYYYQDESFRWHRGHFPPPFKNAMVGQFKVSTMQQECQYLYYGSTFHTKMKIPPIINHFRLHKPTYRSIYRK